MLSVYLNGTAVYFVGTENCPYTFASSRTEKSGKSVYFALMDLEVKRERIAYAPGNSRSFRGMDPGGDLYGNIRSGAIRKVFQTQERQEGFRRLRGRAGTVRKAFQSQNQSQKRFVGDRSIRDRSLRSIRVRSILFRARIIHGFKIRNVFSPR